MNISDDKFDSQELNNIIEADDLKISPLRDDRKTFGTPTWIWAVEVNGDLYVRAYNGIRSRWYNAAVKQKAGQIHAAGMVKDVIFETVSADIDKLIDEAYREKYSGSPYLPPMISERAKKATIRIIPR